MTLRSNMALEAAIPTTTSITLDVPDETIPFKLKDLEHDTSTFLGRMVDFLALTSPTNMLVTNTQIRQYHQKLKEMENFERSGHQIRLTNIEISNLRK